MDTCYDGEEALEYILTENYDLIVLDLNLPGMDGMEILKNSDRAMRRQRFLYYRQEGRLQIKSKGWMLVRMIIWKSRFIYRNLRLVSEV